MIRITDILEEAQRYMTDSELEAIEKAYIFSASVHQGQVRLSGEPYLNHPLEVAGILVSMKLDVATIITGLLHDTVEDTLTTIDQIESTFGKEVAFLVDGLTKISRIVFASRLEQQADYFRKMIMAMSSDIRILMVRLADRLHNMRTLEYHRPERKIFIARETLEVYAALATRLGINWIKTELEDLAFKHLDPEAYNDLIERVAMKKAEREYYTEEIRDIIQQKIQEFGLNGIVKGRAKHFYSIYKKMREQHLNFDEVYDLTAFRIILDSNKEKECYEALSVVHALWKPVPGRFKDYIAMPKANNYRSLHTTVIGPYGERVEIQIRTSEMDEWAEYGIAAHWRYKEGDVSSVEEDRQIQQLRELLESQKEYKDAREFMKNLKLALYPDEVYVFTPHGDVKSFPKGATPIDFAYSIHTDVGHSCVGAKVNRNIVPLKYQLRNGDTVEILTHHGHKPSTDWLKYAVTSRAVSKIKQWIKTEERERSISLGRDILEKELKKRRISLNRFIREQALKELIESQSLGDVDDLLAQIGYGKTSAQYIINNVYEGATKESRETGKDKAGFFEKIKGQLTKTSHAGISVRGVDDVLVRFAKCCCPLPGDEIVGYITRGRGVTVHLASCPQVQSMDPERIIEVHWEVEKGQTYPVNIKINCIDKKGLLAELSNVISKLGINVSHADVSTFPDERAAFEFRLNVNDLAQYKKLVSELKKLNNVLSVERQREPVTERQDGSLLP
ncbi:MAG TPA: bifunctional (p)ppGpp synthetase/guanosine-3',5'-bis(diphosphate) 3'-pyrophosphohydrolase [Deltaproteobacteria bacterium]|nr:bifunctional (p)ppGpp synthetase/guanosine-3',5'-bis(diphosphate) 3'-pyrophosphohydrolase [Deltaproteobacteria bacterium]